MIQKPRERVSESLLKSQRKPKRIIFIDFRIPGNPAAGVRVLRGQASLHLTTAGCLYRKFWRMKRRMKGQV